MNEMSFPLKLSIIIVNYNSSKMLFDCILSIKEKVLTQNYEIIIVDNNSTDCSIKLVEKQWEDIVIIKNSENFGFAKANNIGLNYAKGEYILFLNNDTIFIEDSVAKIFNHLGTYGEKFLVGVKLLNPDRSYQASAFRFPSVLLAASTNLFWDRVFKGIEKFQKYYSILETSSIITKVDYILGAFIFCPRSFIDELGGFDERFFFFHEDSDLCKRAYLLGGKVLFDAGTQIVHIGGGTTNEMQWFKVLNKFSARIQFYQKYYLGKKLFLLIVLEYLGNIIRIPFFLLLGIVLLRKSFLVRSYQHLRLLFNYPQNKFKR